MREWHKNRPGFLISIGIILFITGLLRFYGFGWEVVLMVVGVLIIMKGLYLKSRNE